MEKRPPPETIQIRLLCPSAKTGALIGKGGSVIRQLQSLTSTKIRILDDPFEERIIQIVADSKPLVSNNADNPNVSSNAETKQDLIEDGCNSASGGGGGRDVGGGEEETTSSWSPLQKAVVRVFERIVKGDAADDKETEKESENLVACCRMLLAYNQAACLLGRESWFLEKTGHENGTQIRVLTRDQILPCAAPGDELLQITGNFSAVKKALFSISSFLQENCTHSQLDQFTPWGYTSGRHAADYNSRSYPSNPEHENAVHNRAGFEEEVVFKLLCQADKVGSLIGKGGSVVRALQCETGAGIKIADTSHDSEERIVVISAREHIEQRFSSAQDAVVRVQSRIAEIGFEPGAAIVARLLVPSQHIGYLLGKGGHIVNEMRRATGANIRVSSEEQLSKSVESQNEEVVQVSGSLQSVQDALFHITGRLRESIFPMKPPFPGVNPPLYLPPFPEMPPPLFRPRHNHASPCPYPSHCGPFHGMDASAGPPQPLEHQPPFTHGMDHLGPSNLDRAPYPYGGDIHGHGPMFYRPSSPGSWTPHAAMPRGVYDAGPGFVARNGRLGSGNQAPILTNTKVEIVIPQIYLCHVYGESNSNLGHIRQISGANVAIHDPKPGGAEGLVVVSGTWEQLRTAQSLIQAFILCGQTAA
ncbi:KH domain-containing protein HEN4-like [Hibiscus syriacus]|uniref:KH domain-containing protein HEN4-like n=1 Tax=Hibiscus syriacus TaxID=106335 RepID=UPI00192145C6|nr:KH domain-containing protein HEN4-like [Hibiscus syriacus]XP_039034510.1 KH domain-containing protein HEN4-like [Hibiscus syriacus]